MNLESIKSNNPNQADRKKKLMDDLRLLILTEAEEWLRTAANYPGEKAVATNTAIQENLEVVKDSMVAAEAMMEQNTNATTLHYVRDNIWNWH